MKFIFFNSSAPFRGAKMLPLSHDNQRGIFIVSLGLNDVTSLETRKEGRKNELLSPMEAKYWEELGTA